MPREYIRNPQEGQKCGTGGVERVSVFVWSWIWISVISISVSSRSSKFVILFMYPPFCFGVSARTIIQKEGKNKIGLISDKNWIILFFFLHRQTRASPSNLPLKFAPQSKPSKRHPLKNFDYPFLHGRMEESIALTEFWKSSDALAERQAV